MISGKKQSQLTHLEPSQFRWAAKVYAALKKMHKKVLSGGVHRCPFEGCDTSKE